MKPVTHNRSRLIRWFSAVGAALVLATGTVTPASAAGTFSATAIGAAVSGSTVNSTATFTASVAQTVQYAGVCARDSAGRNVDFPRPASVTLSGTPTGITRKATFAPGTYTYWPCVQAGGVWTNVTAPKTFVVNATPATAPSPGSGSGQAMPVGNLPGLTQVFADDFSTPLARGAFPGPYAAKWLSYNGFPDTSHKGDYDQRIISAQNGTLDLYLHTENGRPLGAAPVPLVDGHFGGQTYGRFSVRMKTDAGLAGYGAGFLLWNDSGDWNDGEIDFPESGLTDVVKGFNHCPGDAARNCYVLTTTARYTQWHTYTIDWTPSKIDYLIDGVSVGSTTSNIPTKPLHWVMQVATTGVTPAPSTAGHMLIDWATIYRYTP